MRGTLSVINTNRYGGFIKYITVINVLTCLQGFVFTFSTSFWKLLTSVSLFFIFFHHANIRVPFESFISHLIITPSLHRTHHSTSRTEHDSNYGIVLSFWDRMFNTRNETAPQNIGLDLIEADNFLQLFSLAFITERKIMKLFGWIPKGNKRNKK